MNNSIPDWNPEQNEILKKSLTFVYELLEKSVNQ